MCLLSRFEEELRKLKEVSNDAWEWISKVAPKHWSRSHFSECSTITKQGSYCRCPRQTGNYSHGND